MKPGRLTEAQAAQISRIEIGSGPGLDLSRFPDFLIIGPQRTGTTWLHHHLFRHPSIFLPRRKETYFFSRLDSAAEKEELYENLEDYLQRAMADSFRDRIRKHVSCLVQSGNFYRPKIRGESTATYAILDAEVIREIGVLNPDLKAILMLRDPVERAWSHARKDLFWHEVPEPEAFPMEEFEKFCRASGQKQLARYSEIIEIWRAHLKPGHLFLGKFGDISERPESLLSAIHEFLGVPAGPRYLDRKRLVTRINPAPDISIPPAALAYLQEQLREMIDDYQAIIAGLGSAGSQIA